MLWHNPAVGRATFARNRTEWVAAATQQLDCWVTAAGSPAAISAACADATTHDGGQVLDVDAPLASIPLFLRDGRRHELRRALPGS
ncbi:hypothetical protein [Aquipuribacter sp. MA13-6]|uniref:hypothetical protein n=1 Tax=unclassified Aquipuribacter TaxID=2635084 RepID=UPI003EF0335B